MFQSVLANKCEKLEMALINSLIETDNCEVAMYATELKAVHEASNDTKCRLEWPGKPVVDIALNIARLSHFKVGTP